MTVTSVTHQARTAREIPTDIHFTPPHSAWFTGAASRVVFTCFVVAVSRFVPMLVYLPRALGGMHQVRCSARSLYPYILI